MTPLERAQANFMETLQKGPGALDRNLFSGPIDRVLLGLKAHASTINHARLVALEDTFPLTRKAMGDEAFNRISRAYIETEAARCKDNNGIGAGYCAFMACAHVDPSAIELSAIEWAWLESYHARDAQALCLNDIAGLPPESLIDLRVKAHPASRTVMVSQPLPTQLAEIAAIMPHPAAILAVRPEAEVRLLPLDSRTCLTFNHTQKIISIGNLLSLCAEQEGDADPSGPVMTLISAGALMEADDASHNRA